MLFIVTRPKTDAVKLMEALQARGHQGICSPVIAIVPRSNGEIPQTSYQAVALSSANAARAVSGLRDHHRLLHLPAFTVGEQSAAAARAAGFVDIKPAGGDVEQLAKLIGGELDPTRGAVLYLSGADTAGDLKGALAAAGFAVDRLVLYDALPAEALSIEAAQAIAAGKAAGVLLYSPRSARIWSDLIQASGLSQNVRGLRHYCLSANVAAALGSDYLTAVASRPQEDALLTLLDPAR